MGPISGRFGSGRVQHQLGEPGGIRVSAILSGSEVSDKYNDGTSGSDVGDPILASSAMVPVSARVVVRAGSCPSKEAVVVGPDEPAASTCGITSTDRLELVRGQYESSGLSSQVVDLLLEESVTPHLLLTSPPGTVGTVGVFEKTRIPCLRL